MTNNLAALELFRGITVKQLIRALLEAPLEAKCEDVFKDPWTKNTIMVFEHESLAIVPEGMTIPRIEKTVW